MLHSSLGDERAVRPPRNFRSAEGVRAAWLSATGPFARTPKGRTPAQRYGLRYEAKVHEHLSLLFPGHYIPSQWFQYIDDRGARRWCQTDGLLSLGTLVVIFEVKARFSADGWWQLRRLYSSVVVAALKPTTLGCCLVTRHYDPAASFPEAHERISDLERWIIRRQFAQVGVFPWRR